jgi:hypothetical protein
MSTTQQQIEQAREEQAFCESCAKSSARRAAASDYPDARASWLDSKRAWEDMAAFWKREVARLSAEVSA